METLNSMLYLLSYNSEVTTHALGVLSSYHIMCMTMKGIHMTIKEMCKQYYLFSFSTSYPIFSISSDAQMNGPTPLPSLSRIGSLI